MKKLLFLCGPNGIGKTTICKEIIGMLHRSAYVDSDPCRMMNPFVLSDETIPTIAKNISDMLINYLDCQAVDTVVFSYGFHGRRREVFHLVMDALSQRDFEFIPFLLKCSVEENMNRMTMDNRSLERKQRAIFESRAAFDDIAYPRIDVTALCASQAAETIITKAGLSQP